MGVVISGKILTWINYILMLYCGLELLQVPQEGWESVFNYEKSLVSRNKEILIATSLFALSVISIWKQYEKILMDKEKRRELKLNNDLKEKQLKDGKDI